MRYAAYVPACKHVLAQTPDRGEHAASESQPDLVAHANSMSEGVETTTARGPITVT